MVLEKTETFYKDFSI